MNEAMIETAAEAIARAHDEDWRRLAPETQDHYRNQATAAARVILTAAASALFQHVVDQIKPPQTQTKIDMACTFRELPVREAAAIVLALIDGTPLENAVRAGLVPESELTPSITCPHCGRESWNRHDIAERYCGACGQFHADMGRTP